MIFESLLQIFKNASFLELTQEVRCGFEQGFKLHTFHTVLEVLVIACSIFLKGTHLELNFKPPLPIITFENKRGFRLLLFVAIFRCA